MIELSFSTSGKSTQICAKIPRNYPNTPFAQFCRTEHDGCFGHLQMSFLDRDSLSDTYEDRRYKLPWVVDYNHWDNIKIPIIFVHSFLVHSQWSKGPQLCTPDEKNMLKGLGTRMMCAGISSVAHKIGDHRLAFVLAEADGAREDVAVAAKQKYVNMSEKDILMELFNKYPTELQEQIPNKDRKLQTGSVKEFLLSMLCRTEANNMLINYYKKMYGFEVWQQSPTSMGCLIGTTVENALQHCHAHLGSTKRRSTRLSVR